MRLKAGLFFWGPERTAERGMRSCVGAPGSAGLRIAARRIQQQTPLRVAGPLEPCEPTRRQRFGFRIGAGLTRGRPPRISRRMPCRAQKRRISFVSTLRPSAARWACSSRVR